MQQLLSLYLALFIFSGLSAAQGDIQFTQDTYSSSVEETVENVGIFRPNDGFITVTCTHIATNNSNNITYEITTLVSPFTINEDNGELMVIADLDYETNTSFVFTVRCTSQLNASLSDEATVHITIQAVNEVRPEVNVQSTTIIISEVTTPGTVLISTLPGGVRMYSASDDDSGPDGNIYYSIGSTTNNASFAFNSTVGALLLAQSFDLDATQEPFIREIFQITVCDAEPPTPDCPNIEVNVIVIAVNDNQPAFNQSSYNVSYPESVGVGTVITQAPCFDLDFSRGAFSGIEIMAVYPSTTPMGTFVIDSITGMVSIGQSLDFEFTDSYKLMLRCFDSGFPVMTDFANVTVAVWDVNDNAPSIDVNTSELIVLNDNSSVNSSVFVIQCSDIDSGSNAEIVFSIVNATDSTLFNIDQATGEVTILNPLTLPNNTFTVEHTVVLECSDGGQPSLSNQTEINFSIYKNDNTPPIIDRDNISNGVVSILENSSPGSNVITIVGRDQSSPSLTYSISNESIQGVFTINSSTGVISLVQPIDRETVDMYTLEVVTTEVRVAPGSPVSTVTNLTIQVEDVNDNSPDCPAVPEQTLPIGTHSYERVFTLTCTDRDAGVNKELRYNPSNFPVLSGGEFVINEQTGELGFAGTITENRVFIISIVVSDLGVPSLSNQVSLVVNITGTTTDAPTILANIPLWVIIVPIVIGLILICCFIMLLMCCCYCCNRRRVDKKRKDLLSDTVAKGDHIDAVVISQYPLDGESSTPVPDNESLDSKEYHLTFETTSFGPSAPTTPTSTSPDGEGYVFSSSQEFTLNSPEGEVGLNPPNGNFGPPEIEVSVEDVGLRTPGFDHSRDILIVKNDGANEEITKV